MDLADEIRRARGLRTQEEFADLLGVSRVTIAQWERRAAIPSLASARLLIEQGVSMDALLSARLPDLAAATA